MSFFINYENELMSFKTFIMSEAITPKQTNYGYDLTNKKWLKFKNLHITFFESNNKFYNVTIDNESGEIGFGVSDTFVNSTSYKDIINFFDDKTQKISLLNASIIFNKVIYVTLQGLKNIHLDEIFFYAGYKDLDDTYSNIVKNDKFLTKMETEGYKFIKKIGKYYSFRKIERNNE